MTYAAAIAWIARHEPIDTDRVLDRIGALQTVAMVSDSFGRDLECVVQDVVAERRRIERERPLRTVADVRRSAAP